MIEHTMGIHVNPWSAAGRRARFVVKTIESRRSLPQEKKKKKEKKSRRKKDQTKTRRK